MAKKKATTAPAPAPAPAPTNGQSDKSGLVGLTITEVRPMHTDELLAEGWFTGPRGVPALLVLSDGTKLYASRDDEGNGPGVLFGAGKEGSFRVG